MTRSPASRPPDLAANPARRARTPPPPTTCPAPPTSPPLSPAAMLLPVRLALLALLLAIGERVEGKWAVRAAARHVRALPPPPAAATAHIPPFPAHSPPPCFRLFWGAIRRLELGHQFRRGRRRGVGGCGAWTGRVGRAPTRVAAVVARAGVRLRPPPPPLSPPAAPVPPPRPPCHSTPATHAPTLPPPPPGVGGGWRLPLPFPALPGPPPPPWVGRRLLGDWRDGVPRWGE